MNFVYVGIYSYILGCFCTAYYLVKIYGNRDIRKINSGTVGARNAGRALGKKGFIITFAGDFLKTALALLITIKAFETDRNFPFLLSVSAACVMIGHTLPLQLQFKGGKGVVPFVAIIFVINLPVLLISLAALFLLLAITGNQKISILAAILLTIPSGIFFMNYYPIFLNWTTFTAISFAIILIILLHLKKS